MEHTPLVSVIMPAYQAQAHIEEAVRSVMAQTLADWELLVIDDGSADETVAAVTALGREDSRVRLLVNDRNLGAAASRNRGIAQSRGQYLAFLDSDDVWRPEKLERQLAAMARTGAGLCCCAYEMVDGQGRPLKQARPVPERVTFSRLLRENVIGCSTVVVRREALGARRFSTDYLHEDYVLWLELLRDGVAALGCPEVLAGWRMAAGSRSADKGKSAASRWRIYRSYLGLPLYRSVYYFAAYALTGIRKYFI